VPELLSTTQVRRACINSHASNHLPAGRTDAMPSHGPARPGTQGLSHRGMPQGGKRKKGEVGARARPLVAALVMMIHSRRADRRRKRGSSSQAGLLDQVAGAATESRQTREPNSVVHRVSTLRRMDEPSARPAGRPLPTSRNFRRAWEWCTGMYSSGAAASQELTREAQERPST
jgi:hypothetical protein